MIEVKTVTLVTCNRCGHEDTWSSETPDYLRLEWSRLDYFYSTVNGFELCPACTREVKAWIRNGR